MSSAARVEKILIQPVQNCWVVHRIEQLSRRWDSYLSRDGMWEVWFSRPLCHRFLFWTREEAEEALALRVLLDQAEGR